MNWKNSKEKKRIESEKEASGNTVASNRDKRIAELEAEIIKAKQGIAETGVEIERLLNAENEAKRIYSKEVAAIMEDNPDTSVKGQIDLIYKTSNRSLAQTRSSLEKMHLAKGNYTLKQRKAYKELAELKEQIKLEALDAQVKDLFEKTKSWVADYNRAQATFDNLKQTIIEMPGYNTWKTRIDELKLPGSYHVLADSHLNNPEGLSMDRLAVVFSEMTKGSDPYSWPNELRIEFDVSRDDVKPFRDSFATKRQDFGFVENSDEMVMNKL